MHEEQLPFLGPIGVLYWFSHVALINLLELAGKAGLRLFTLSFLPAYLSVLAWSSSGMAEVYGRETVSFGHRLFSASGDQ